MVSAKDAAIYALRTHPHVRQPPEVWRAFQNLCLPKWDLDFIKRVPWRKQPVGVRVERMEGKLCPMDGSVETHERVLSHCQFSAVLFGTMRNAFGLVSVGKTY